MGDEARPVEHPPPQVQKRRGWPWVLGGSGLFLVHAAFFLPFRAVVPIPGWVDPWWAIALVLFDETATALLIVKGVAKFRSKITNENADPE